MPLPSAKPPDGATLFKQQCATCHTTNRSDTVRQGPSLFKVVGRQAGKSDDFHYSPGFGKADFVWDDARLDAYLCSPSFVRGATYRVLRGGDGKLGLYHVVRAGGRLDSEMFPETMAIRDFRDVSEYEKLLCDRHVDQILHFASYDASRHTMSAGGTFRFLFGGDTASFAYTLDGKGATLPLTRIPF